ncbi:hypothetical protein [Bdellovibrio svalbardensis]|uniref:Uncharacterized protein n=1 Tax=Bdellovibrio svalbardensis TaxID=2972972 RepID=A0ABT6DQ07_9BACT|nr:hypothetical protein [Bdellovibrio svalbardensis]MDG0817921.1 hypothetical protein [Bdellovibrio svalbardensis]
MSFKDLYNHILLGAGVTALVTVISGAAAHIVPLSKSSIAEVLRPPNALTQNLKIAPQCKVITKLYEIPRCQDMSQAESKNRLH